MKENLICLPSHAAGNVRRVQPSAFAGDGFVAKECGASAIDKYVALRRSGLTENQAFARAFGKVFDGDAETVLKAAQAFEGTKLYEQAFASTKPYAPTPKEVPQKPEKVA